MNEIDVIDKEVNELISGTNGNVHVDRIRKWSAKSIANWNKQAEDNNSKLLDKCSGTNYSNKTVKNIAVSAPEAPETTIV